MIARATAEGDYRIGSAAPLGYDFETASVCSRPAKPAADLERPGSRGIGPSCAGSIHSEPGKGTFDPVPAATARLRSLRAGALPCPSELAVRIGLLRSRGVFGLDAATSASRDASGRAGCFPAVVRAARKREVRPERRSSVFGGYDLDGNGVEVNRRENAARLDGRVDERDPLDRSLAPRTQSAGEFEAVSDRCERAQTAPTRWGTMGSEQS